MDKLTINPKLARYLMELGQKENIADLLALISQLQCWIDEFEGEERDGRKWVWIPVETIKNTVSWSGQICWLSGYQIRQRLKNLTELGLIEMRRVEARGEIRRDFWYAFTDKGQGLLDKATPFVDRLKTTDQDLKDQDLCVCVSHAHEGLKTGEDGRIEEWPEDEFTPPLSCQHSIGLNSGANIDPEINVPPATDEYALLAQIEDFLGVEPDLGLTQLVLRSPDAVPAALEAVRENEPRNPVAMLKAAISQRWQPRRAMAKAFSRVQSVAPAPVAPSREMAAPAPVAVACAQQEQSVTQPIEMPKEFSFWKAAQLVKKGIASNLAAAIGWLKRRYLHHPSEFEMDFEEYQNYHAHRLGNICLLEANGVSSAQFEEANQEFLVHGKAALSKPCSELTQVFFANGMKAGSEIDVLASPSLPVEIAAANRLQPADVADAKSLQPAPLKPEPAVQPEALPSGSICDYSQFSWESPAPKWFARLSLELRRFSTTREELIERLFVDAGVEYVRLTNGLKVRFDLIAGLPTKDLIDLAKGDLALSF